MSFTNKVVIVTGASSGIGAAIAIAFSAEGAKVVMVGRNEKKLAAVASECNNPKVVIADLTKESDARNVIDETIKTFGQLDVLVNNAGFSVAGSILRGNMMKAYDSIMDINVRAVVQLTTLAAPHLLKTKGNIVNVSSVAGLVPGINIQNYNISKAALTHFGQCAALELAPHGVRVNTVSPGPVETDFLENAQGWDGITWDHLKKRTVLQRISEPSEIADLVLFLASDKARGITGSNFVSDNGQLLKRS